MKNLYTALLAAKKEIGAIAKDSTNPYYNSTYFDINAVIEEVEPVLLNHGLIIMQPLCSSGERPTLITKIVHAESGEELSWSNLLIDNTDPQKLGSVITYFRRYALVSLLCLRAEDDDANTASKPTIAPKTKPVSNVPKNHQEPTTEQSEANGEAKIIYCDTAGCGGTMKKKNGVKGAFYGCSNYAHGCRNTLNVEQAEG